MLKYFKNRKGSIEVVLWSSIIIVITIIMLSFRAYILADLNITRDMINSQYSQIETQVESNTINNLMVN